MPKGGDEMASRLRKLSQAMELQAKSALLVFAESIMTESKSKFVPVDTGTLRSSGFVEHVPGKLQVVLGYGGAASAYALAVHEHLSDMSPSSWKIAEATGNPVRFHPAGRGPKYLERPLMEAVGRMPDALKQMFNFENLA